METIITKIELGDYLKEKNGAGEETRTLDSHLGKVALYQLSYTRSIKDLRP
jgi:hypothetical protein